MSDAPRTLHKPDFSMNEVHAVVKDLFQPNPTIYWLDFILSFGCGLAAFHFVQRFEFLSWQQILLYATSVVLYYRSALFIHEIVHFREKSMRAFRFVWNLFCGIPFLMPTFMYYTHSDHHVRKHYSTHDDGEYLPLAAQHPWHLVVYLLQPFIVPVLAVFRFMVLAPLGWLIPPLRELIHRRASSMVIDFKYCRPLPSRKVARVMRLQEVGCFLFCWGAAALIYFVNRPPYTIWLVVQAYATAVGILMLNHVRTLGAHRYVNGLRREMTFTEQLLDSVNYPNYAWLVELAMPVGLRFHALHHLCPALPYHSLGIAHRRLMASLPADSIYRRTVSPSLSTALWQVFKLSFRSIGKPPTTPQLDG